VNRLREQIRSLLRVESREGGFRALLQVDPQLIVLPDHFPEFPLLPGICMIQAVLLAGAIRQDVAELHVRRLKNAKFTRPVRPGEQLVIDAEMIPGADGEFAIIATLSTADRPCAELSLVAGQDRTEKEARQ
jgi:3-hydroxyacyl-[acyl-carrier-protein] dehydratase